MSGWQKAVRPGIGHSAKVVRCSSCQRSMYAINAHMTETDGVEVWSCKSASDCAHTIRNNAIISVHAREATDDR